MQQSPTSNASCPQPESLLQDETGYTFKLYVAYCCDDGASAASACDCSSQTWCTVAATPADTAAGMTPQRPALGRNSAHTHEAAVAAPASAAAPADHASAAAAGVSNSASLALLLHWQLLASLHPNGLLCSAAVCKRPLHVR